MSEHDGGDPPGHHPGGAARLHADATRAHRQAEAASRARRRRVPGPRLPASRLTAPALPWLPSARPVERARAVRGSAAEIAELALRGARAGARAALSPAGLRGLAVEGAWVAAHIALYPLGVAAERARPDNPGYGLGALPPVRRGLLIGDVEAAATPILLVHGMIDNRSVFTLLRRGLRRRGFGRVHTFNFPVLTRDLRVAATALSAQVEAICAETGYERLHIVGHSLGGLVARYYVQRLGGDARVHTLVTLGTPHGGTLAAHLLPHRLCRQLRPGSDVLRELAAPAPGLRTRFLCIGSDLDQLVVPSRAALLDHPDLRVRNLRVPGIGHTSLPVDGRVVHAICLELAHLDADGSTVAPAVTTLDPAPEVAGPWATSRAARLDSITEADAGA